MSDQIVNCVRAGFPGLYLVSHEEMRVLEELKSVANRADYKLFTWSITQGILDDAGRQLGSADPLEMLDQFAALREKSILVAKDFHQFMDGEIPNPVITRKLKDALLVAKNSNRVLVILGCRIVLPPELEKEIKVVQYKLPTREELRPVLEAVAKSGGIELNGNTDPILDAATGQTTIEAENSFAMSVIEAGDILPSIVAREKAETVKKNGILEIIESSTSLQDVGGLDVMKDWLTLRRQAFTKQAKDYGLPVPKGVLAIGIPGCGKSLTAKATANILGIPILKLDAGKIFAAHVGESEANLRTAIQTAEAVAPCVLWIDEIEKGFAGSKSSGQTDGGVSARVFGSFLQWLQEKTSPVFVFATANDISALPPEFLRKGRFDEIWFVDLPDTEERANIWAIQIAKRRRDPDSYDLTGLARMSDGWTGSEIESVFVEGLYAAFYQKKEPDDLMLAELGNKLVPLSRTMREQVDALRQWANGRARRASAPKSPNAAGRKLAA